MDKKQFKSYIEYPLNPNIPIWRYMSFSKFMSMLAHNSLYFCRGDNFQDKYEGYLNRNSEVMIDSLFHEFTDQAKMVNELKYLFKEARKMILINCWHMNSSESDAMWKVYSLEHEGIAIKSNIEKLKSCFRYEQNPIFIRPVKYIDYEADIIKELHPTELFVRKRKHFEHEQELRVMILRFNSTRIEEIRRKAKNDEEIPVDYVERGELIPVSFDVLVEKVFVSPNSPNWFYELVKKLTNLVYNIEVIHSQIYNEP